MTRRALVTGAAGFTARHLTSLLVDLGWEVHGTIRGRASGIAGVQEHSVDMGDWPALQQVVVRARPDVVFHLAAVVDTVQTPDLGHLFRTNTEGTAALLAAVGTARSVEKVVVASSAFAYGRPAVQEQTIAETTPLCPVTPYGASKAAAEAIAFQWWRQHGTDLVVTRGFQHTGPGHVGPYALADWARQLAGGADLIEVGNLEVVRDYLDVRDAAAAYVALAESGHPGEAYNVGSGVPRSMGSMVEGLLAAFGSTARVRPSAQRLRTVDQPSFVADVSKLKEHTNWSATYPMDQTLSDLSATARRQTHARWSK